MTSLNPYVSKLFIYPIKSLDGIEVKNVTVLASGAIKGDRQFAMFDESDRFINGKRNYLVHSLRSQFNSETKTVSLSFKDNENTTTFNLETEQNVLENWLRKYFAIPVSIKQNLTHGFPDDTASPGPTIVSTETLKAIASWYPELDVKDVRLRFRANIEIDGVPAFWEDRLFAEAGNTVDFQIGDVRFMGVNPCQRCVVITRNPKTGEVYHNFQKTFIAKRKETLPNWTEKTRFNHFYRLAINTKLPETEEGKRINLEDILKVNLV